MIKLVIYISYCFVSAQQQNQYRAPAYNQAPVYNQAPAVQYQQASAHAQPAQIPAGVDARACPNYPFCS